MDFIELLKNDHEKASELMDRLGETSDNAVRTRERLFAQLKTEIETHSKIEEDQLYPRMRKHRETRDVVNEALEAHKTLARLLGELESMQKGDGQFLPKLAELKRSFQEHRKAEEENYLPAVQRAFADNEEKELSRELEAEKKQLGGEMMGESGGAEQAGRAMRGMAEAAAESGERVAQSSRAAMQRGSQEMVETSRRMAEAGTQVAQHATKSMANQAEEMGRQAMAVAQTYGETAHATSEDLQAMMTCSRIAAGGMSDMRRAWMEWLGRALHAQTQASQEIMRCTSPHQFVEIQSTLMKDSMSDWLEGSAEILRISHRIAGEALRPIEERVNRSAHAGNRPQRRHEPQQDEEMEQEQRQESEARREAQGGEQQRERQPQVR